MSSLFLLLLKIFTELLRSAYVEPDYNSYANSLVPTIESVEKLDLKPEQPISDSSHGSDGNSERTRGYSVELIAPIMGVVDSDL